MVVVSSARAEWRSGWTIVLGAMLAMGTGFALLGPIFSVFVKPMAADLGWSRSTFGLIAIAAFGSALTMPLMGRLVDRHGASPFVLAGSVLFAITYIGLATMSGALWQFIALIVFIGFVAGPPTSPLVMTRPLVSAFVAARGTALAIGMSGGFLIAAVTLPIVQHIIAGYGWRSAFLFLSPLSLVLGVISFLLLRGGERATDRILAEKQDRNDPLPTVPGATLRQALGTQRFWILGGAVIATTMIEGSIVTQLQPLLIDVGMTAATAAWLGSCYATGVIVGRLGAGLLLDRLWPPGVAAVSVLGPSIGMTLLLTPHPHLFLCMVAVGLLGLSSGAAGDTLAFFISRYFGLRHFGVIFGVLGLMFGISFAIGAAGAGALFDLANSYRPMLFIGAALSAIGALCFLMAGLNRSPKNDPAWSQPSPVTVSH